MLRKHKDFKKYFGESVVYVENEEAAPRRMVISDVHEGMGPDGPYLLFDLIDRSGGPLYRGERRDYRWYLPVVKGAKEVQLWPNMSSYLKDLTDRTEKRLSSAEYMIEVHQRELKTAREEMDKNNKKLYESLMADFKDKPYSATAFKDLLARLPKMQAQHGQKKCDQILEAIAERKAETSRLKAILRRATRGERSRRIRREWAERHKTI